MTRIFLTTHWTTDNEDDKDFLDYEFSELNELVFTQKCADIRRKGIFGDANKINDCEKFCVFLLFLREIIISG